MLRAGLRGLAALVLLAGAVAPIVGTPGSSARAQPADEPVASGESPLKRKDVPPQGVDALFGLGGGAGSGSCTFREGQPVETAFGESECVVEIADSTELSFEGLAPEQEVVFRFTRPDGAVEEERGTASGLGRAVADRAALPGDPLGVYSVVASQGTRQVTGAFTVRGATGRQNIVHPRVGPPGTTFRIALAGLEPDQSVALRFYRSLGLDYAYLTSVPAVQVDERGEALYTLRTAVDDPEGAYIVDTAPVRAGSVFKRTFDLIRGGDRAAVVAEQTEALALAVVEDAARVLASVVAKDGAPIAELERAFGGQALAEARADVQRLRAEQRYAVLTPTAPIAIRTTRWLDSRAGCSSCREAVAIEQWEKQLYNADESLAAGSRVREEWRYVMSWDAGPDSTQRLRYRIVEQELLRSE